MHRLRFKDPHFNDEMVYHNNLILYYTKINLK